jgi:serine/threonine-protein kinase
MLIAPANATSTQRAAPAAAAATMPGTVELAPAKKSQATAIAVVVAVAIIALGGLLWSQFQRPGADSAKLAKGTPNTAAPPPAAVAPPVPAATPAATRTDPGSMTISAEGLVDPNDPRYGTDKALLQSDLRADAKSQVVAKALGLMIDPGSLAKYYDIVRDKLLAQSGNYISTVVTESPPRLGKDGLMSMTTQAVVNVRALQKSVNQMSRDERVDFIRSSGDPKISVSIAVRDADQPNAPPQASPVAENLLKERIKAFGFRTWSEDGNPADPKQNADFAVLGEVQMKKLSARLEASGVVVTKYTLTSWTVKCIDRATGEEIYFNTALPKGVGSWAGEGDAMKAIGAKIADEFSRNFFLQHVTVSGRKVTLSIDGLPDSAQEALLRELVGLPAVITAASRSGSKPGVYDLQLAGDGAEGDLVAAGVLKPLNAKFGQPCFSLGRIAGEEVNVIFAKACTDSSILSRLETNPPAGLYGAPPGRQKALIKDPETLRRLVI